jgi:hypothetical protein
MSSAAAEHADRAVGWVAFYHSLPHKLFTPMGESYAITPESAYDSPLKWAQASAWTPAWTWLVMLLVFIGLVATVTGAAVCCSCTCCRRSHPRCTTITVALLGVLAVGSFLTFTVLTNASLLQTTNGFVDIVKDAKAHLDTCVATAKMLRNETVYATTLAGQWRDSGVFSGDPNSTEELNAITDIFNSTSEISADVVNQIDRDYDIDSYTDPFDSGMRTANWSGALFFTVIGLAVASAVALGAMRIGCSVHSTKADQEVRDKQYRAGACALVSVGALLFGLLLFTTLGYAIIASVAASGCYQPYDYLNLVVNNGNQSATVDDSEVLTFYVRCTNPDGGPVNANINEAYSNIVDVESRLTRLKNITDNNPSTPANVRQITVDLMSTVAESKQTVNTTRRLVDCRRLHEFSEQFLDRVCGELVPRASTASVFVWLGFISFFTLLLLVSIAVVWPGPTRDAALAGEDEKRELLALPKSMSS